VDIADRRASGALVSATKSPEHHEPIGARVLRTCERPRQSAGVAVEEPRARRRIKRRQGTRLKSGATASPALPSCDTINATTSAVDATSQLASARENGAATA